MKHLINANTIAFVLEYRLSFWTFNIIQVTYHILNKLYNLFYNSFNAIGNTTTPLSMLFIGLILSEVKIKSIKELKKRIANIYIVTF